MRGIPATGRGLAAIPDQELAERMCAFLAAAVVPEILADYPNDYALLRRPLAQAYPPTEWKPILVEQSYVCAHHATYLDRNPERSRFRHHVLVDAEALRWAFHCVNEGVG